MTKAVFVFERKTIELVELNINDSEYAISLLDNQEQLDMEVEKQNANWKKICSEVITSSVEIKQ